jgi:hypothetical protein
VKVSTPPFKLEVSVIDQTSEVLRLVDEIAKRSTFPDNLGATVEETRWLCGRLRTALKDTDITDERVERAARAICDEWGYCWDCDDPEDDQCCGDDFNVFDERPTKTLFRRAAASALKAAMSPTTGANREET